MVRKRRKDRSGVAPRPAAMVLEGATPPLTAMVPEEVHADELRKLVYRARFKSRVNARYFIALGLRAKRSAPQVPQTPTFDGFEQDARRRGSY